METQTTQEIENSQDIKASNTPDYPSWADLFAIIGVLVLSVMGASLITLVLSKTSVISPGFAMFISYCLQFLCAIVFALWQKQRKAPGVKLFNFSLRGANPGIILWGFCLVLLLSVLIEPLVFLFPEFYFDYISNLIGMGGWVMLTSIICAPILEEVLFRGIIQSSITHKKGKILGVLITSAIFGAVHIIPPQAINAFFVSLVLGFIFISSRSLLVVIIIHALNNAVSYLAMTLNDGKILSTKSLIQNNTTYNVIYTCAVVVFFIVIINLVKRIKKQTNNNEVD